MVFLRGGRLEEEDVAVREDAADDARARWSINGKAQGADGDFAVVADADAGAEAPNKAPPRAGWSGADAGVFLAKGGLMRGVCGGGEFTMEFVMIGVVEEGIEQGVCRFHCADGVRGEEWRKSLLPVVVAALNLPFACAVGA